LAVELIPLLLLWPVLGAVAYQDFRYMRIPNRLVFYAVLIFALSCPFLTLEDIGIRIAAAAIVLVFGFVLFAFRLFGGGDVKMMAVLMLFVPAGAFSAYAFVFSFSMILGVLIIITLRTFVFRARSSFVSMRAAGTFPMGVSISLSGFVLPLVMSSV
jgi:prepilin peptidase CpaA